MHSANGAKRSAGFADTAPRVAHCPPWLNWSASTLVGYGSSLVVVAPRVGGTGERGAHFAKTKTNIDSAVWRSREKRTCVSTTAGPAVDTLKPTTEAGASRCCCLTGLHFTSMLSPGIAG